MPSDRRDRSWGTSARRWAANATIGHVWARWRRKNPSPSSLAEAESGSGSARFSVAAPVPPQHLEVFPHLDVARIAREDLPKHPIGLGVVAVFLQQRMAERYPQ